MSQGGSRAFKKFKKLEEGSGKAHFPNRVDYDYPFISPKRGERERHETSTSKPRPKIIAKHVMVTDVDQLGPHIGKLAEAIAAPPSNVEEERIFFDKSKLAKADRRRGIDRTVKKLRKDYEAGIAAERVGRESPGERRRRAMGSLVRTRVGGYQELCQEKEKIRLRAEEKKMALAAEKEAEMARIEAEEAKRKKKRHEEMQEELTARKEKIVAQEHLEKMSNLADKKENIVEEEFKEGVKKVEENAEMERKVAEEEQQRMEAARRKWYDQRDQVPAHLIYTPMNVQEKKADMDKLVKEIEKDTARGRRSHRARGD